MIEDNMPGQFDLQSILIRAVEARPLLWNDNLQLNKNSETLKNKLWNEVFIEMNGKYLLINMYIYLNYS